MLFSAKRATLVERRLYRPAPSWHVLSASAGLRPWLWLSASLGREARHPCMSRTGQRKQGYCLPRFRNKDSPFSCAGHSSKKFRSLPSAASTQTAKPWPPNSGAPIARVGTVSAKQKARQHLDQQCPNDCRFGLLTWYLPMQLPPRNRRSLDLS